jgi:glycosyltransferase involved in cell wall biosynthesis
MDRPALSVVLPTRNRPEMLARALANLSPTLQPGDELVVVDSASTDAAGVAAVAHAAGARLVRCERKGETRARNAGWRAATHDLLAFTDDDVVVAPGWADAFAHAFTVHPDAAFFTGRTGWPPDQPEPERPVSVKLDPEPAVLDATSRGDLGHCANLAIRRPVLAAIGGFDEALGAGGRFRAGPDVDLFDRLFGAGHTGRYEPTALAYHDQWRDRRDLFELEWSYGVGNGARLAKLVRTDRARARRVAREVFWDWGVRSVAANVRSGFKTGVALTSTRLLATATGVVRALPVPVESGHLRPRESSRS